MLSQHSTSEGIAPTRHEGWFGHYEGLGGAVIQVLGVDLVGFLAAVGEGGCDARVALSHEEEGGPGEDPEEGEVGEPAEVLVLAEGVDAVGGVDDDF